MFVKHRGPVFRPGRTGECDVVSAQPSKQSDTPTATVLAAGQEDKENGKAKPSPSS